MNDLLYEVRPYLFATLGLWAVNYTPPSELMRFCGLLLIYAGLQVIYWRFRYRYARNRH